MSSTTLGLTAEHVLAEVQRLQGVEVPKLRGKAACMSVFARISDILNQALIVHSQCLLSYVSSTTSGKGSCRAIYGTDIATHT